MRMTEKDANECAKNLAEILGKKFGDCYKDGKGLIGCWKLDCNPIYGGCVINEIMNEAGGVKNPILEERLSPREFCTAVRFAERVCRIKKGE